MAGYSTTPLAKKLGLKDGMRVWWPHMPASVRAEIDTMGLSLVHLETAFAPVDAAHVFVVRHVDLEAAIGTLRECLAPAGFAWVSWPKKSSRMATEVDEHAVRHVALPTGLVDTKVCAVDETWSGLKLVIRRELRNFPNVR